MGVCALLIFSCYNLLMSLGSKKIMIKYDFMHDDNITKI